MATVKQINDQNKLGMTELQIKQLSQIIEEMEIEFNATNEDDEFGLTNLFLDENNDLAIECMEEMVNQGTTVDKATLDKLNTTMSEAEYQAIATNIKNEVSL
ncbi:hypothetical protein BUY35_00210 [Staphylococcus cohnii]|nr:hypothetical protein BUY35_00210 [Staphylococcus cohnii]